MRVLVVDDSAPVRMRLLALMRESCGLELCEASTAPEALALLSSSLVDAAILDIRLGEKNGLVLIREVKCRKPDALVVVLTNAVTDAHRRACLLRGADFFLDKSRHFEHAAELVLRRAAAIR